MKQWIGYHDEDVIEHHLKNLEKQIFLEKDKYSHYHAKVWCSHSKNTKRICNNHFYLPLYVGTSKHVAEELLFDVLIVYTKYNFFYLV